MTPRPTVSWRTRLAAGFLAATLSCSSTPALRLPAALWRPSGRPLAGLSLGPTASLFLPVVGARLPWAAREENDSGSPALRQVGLEESRDGSTALTAALAPTMTAGLEEVVEGRLSGLSGAIRYGVYLTAAQIGESLASKIVEGLGRASEDRPYLLGLPVGSTPLPTIQALVHRLPATSELWRRLRVVVVNDYVDPSTGNNLADDHPDSAVAETLKMFQSPMDVRPVIGAQQIVRPRVGEGQVTGLVRHIIDAGGLPLLIVAVGPDASVAHNFPAEEGFPADTVTHPFDHDAPHPFTMSYKGYSQKAKQWGQGVSFTLADLMAIVAPGGEVAFVATGATKRDAVVQFMTVKDAPERGDELPIYFLWRPEIAQRVHLYLDRDTGAGLLTAGLEERRGPVLRPEDVRIWVVAPQEETQDAMARGALVTAIRQRLEAIAPPLCRIPSSQVTSLVYGRQPTASIIEELRRAVEKPALIVVTYDLGFTGTGLDVARAVQQAPLRPEQRPGVLLVSPISVAWETMQARAIQRELGPSGALAGHARIKPGAPDLSPLYQAITAYLRPRLAATPRPASTGLEERPEVAQAKARVLAALRRWASRATLSPNEVVILGAETVEQLFDVLKTVGQLLQESDAQGLRKPLVDGRLVLVTEGVPGGAALHALFPGAAMDLAEAERRFKGMRVAYFIDRTKPVNEQWIRRFGEPLPLRWRLHWLTFPTGDEDRDRLRLLRLSLVYWEEAVVGEDNGSSDYRQLADALLTLTPAGLEEPPALRALAELAEGVQPAPPRSPAVLISPLLTARTRQGWLQLGAPLQSAAGTSLRQRLMAGRFYLVTRDEALARLYKGQVFVTMQRALTRLQKRSAVFLLREDRETKIAETLSARSAFTILNVPKPERYKSNKIVAKALDILRIVATTPPTSSPTITWDTQLSEAASRVVWFLPHPNAPFVESQPGTAPSTTGLEEGSVLTLTEALRMIRQWQHEEGLLVVRVGEQEHLLAALPDYALLSGELGPSLASLLVDAADGGNFVRLERPADRGGEVVVVSAPADEELPALDAAFRAYTKAVAAVYGAQGLRKWALWVASYATVETAPWATLTSARRALAGALLKAGFTTREPALEEADRRWATYWPHLPLGQIKIPGALTEHERLGTAFDLVQRRAAMSAATGPSAKLRTGLEERRTALEFPALETIQEHRGAIRTQAQQMVRETGALIVLVDQHLLAPKAREPQEFAPLSTMIVTELGHLLNIGGPSLQVVLDTDDERDLGDLDGQVLHLVNQATTTSSRPWQLRLTNVGDGVPVDDVEPLVVPLTLLALTPGYLHEAREVDVAAELNLRVGLEEVRKTLTELFS